MMRRQNQSGEARFNTISLFAYYDVELDYLTGHAYGQVGPNTTGN